MVQAPPEGEKGAHNHNGEEPNLGCRRGFLSQDSWTSRSPWMDFRNSEMYLLKYLEVKGMMSTT